MISSQIDADRMDYLLRDAYFTGTEYGTFDLTRILRSHSSLCWRDRIFYEWHACSRIILSSRQMYVQVYFHASSREWKLSWHIY